MGFRDLGFRGFGGLGFRGWVAESWPEKDKIGCRSYWLRAAGFRVKDVFIGVGSVGRWL